MNIRAVSIATLAAASSLLVSAGAHAGISAHAVITADNHYALYTGDPITGITSLGRNELGAGGAPGQYNWSEAEVYDFSPGQYIYIAGWSDDSIAQGLLADITLDDGSNLRSGFANWQVMVTNSNLGDGDAAPTTAAIAAYVLAADAGNLWFSPDIGGANVGATSPWGQVPVVDASTRWMWGNPAGVGDVFNGGANHSEYQIFRIPVQQVPAPMTCSALALGGLIAARRRR